MDIWKWLKERRAEFSEKVAEKDRNGESASGFIQSLGTYDACQSKLRELYGWKPGPPPSDPEDGSQWELLSDDPEISGSVEILCTYHSGEFHFSPEPFGDFLTDQILETVFRHRRIMPAPEDQS